MICRVGCMDGRISVVLRGSVSVRRIAGSFSCLDLNFMDPFGQPSVGEDPGPRMPKTPYDQLESLAHRGFPRWLAGWLGALAVGMTEICDRPLFHSLSLSLSPRRNEFLPFVIDFAVVN
jgi:hypothetical protein